MSKHTFTVACPVCGFCESGMDPSKTVAVILLHQMSMVVSDDDYARLVGETLLEAERVVGC